MRITESRLRTIIREELTRVSRLKLREDFRVDQAVKALNKVGLKPGWEPAEALVKKAVDKGLHKKLGITPQELMRLLKIWDSRDN